MLLRLHIVITSRQIPVCKRSLCVCVCVCVRVWALVGGGSCGCLCSVVDSLGGFISCVLDHVNIMLRLFMLVCLWCCLWYSHTDVCNMCVCRTYLLRAFLTKFLWSQLDVKGNPMSAGSNLCLCVFVCACVCVCNAFTMPQWINGAVRAVTPGCEGEILGAWTRRRMRASDPKNLKRQRQKWRQKRENKTNWTGLFSAVILVNGIHGDVSILCRNMQLHQWEDRQRRSHLDRRGVAAATVVSLLCASQQKQNPLSN